ncbi:uncharacterized protein LY89DRAFT_615017 [Mollisia scopiformis]
MYDRPWTKAVRDRIRQDTKRAIMAEGASTSLDADVIISGTMVEQSTLKGGMQALVSQDDAAPTPGSICTIPNELLSQILGHLDTKSISADLFDEPRLDITQASIADLKAVSCVSSLWRQIAFPILFKHARFIVPEPKDHRPAALENQIKPFLAFAIQNSLHTITESFTLIVQDANVSSIGQNPLDRFSSFWISIFDILDPLELLVAAPPEVLGALAACFMILGQSWQFRTPCQYLQLKQSKPSPTSQLKTEDNFIRAQKLLESQIREANDTGNFGPPAGQAPRNIGGSIWPDNPNNAEAEEIAFPARAERSTLLQGRPWSKLLLNEGSSIRAYASYEWWMRSPPSILSDLVGADFDNQKALISPTVRDFSYIGIFPFAKHFRDLVKFLPRLDRLYTQFVPRNQILQDPIRMAQVEATDLWSERNTAYSYLMEQLFNAPPIGSYKYLREFESGDAADKDAWNMAVQYVQRMNGEWKVEKEGVFVRDLAVIGPESDTGDNSLLSV